MIFHKLIELTECYNINIDFLYNSLEKQLKNSSACGLSIIHGDKVYYEVVGSVDGKNSKLCDLHTQFPLSSLTKIFTGLMIESLVTDRILSYDDTLGKVCPRTLLSALKIDSSVTLEMIMSHQSGMLNGKISHYSEAYAKSLEEFVIGDLPKVRVINHGKGCFHYSDVAINFLGYLCEHITQVSFRQLIENYVLQPLELKDTCFPYGLSLNNACGGILKYDNEFISLNHYKDNPSFYPSNQLYSSFFDISRLLHYFLNNFQKLHRLFEPQSSMPAHRFYCRSWVYERYKNKNVYFHHGADLGVLGRVYIIPSENVGIALLSNAESIGYSERVIHYLLNKIHMNSQDDPILEIGRTQIIVNLEQEVFSKNYLSISGKARKLSFMAEKDKMVMIFQCLGFDKKEIYEVKCSNKNKEYKIIAEDGEHEKLQILNLYAGKAYTISYKGWFYEAVTSYEKEEKNKELFIQNLGLYYGILEYQSKEERCELYQSEDGSLHAKFQYSDMEIFPHPAKSNVFLSSLGRISFVMKEDNVIGFTMKSFLNFSKIIRAKCDDLRNYGS